MTKGIGEYSGRKHALINQLVSMQVARALTFLPPGSRVLVVDMHAGDSAGAKAIQPDLFAGDESRATPWVAIDAAERMRRNGMLCDLLLFERSHKARTELTTRLAGLDLRISGNHERLLKANGLDQYAFAIVLNDPNGPGRHGDRVLAYLAKAIRRCDFIIVVNEGSLQRLAGVSDEQAAGSFAANVAAARDGHLWRLDAAEWAWRLERRFALRSRMLIGNTAMKARLLLITNAPPMRTPPNFTKIEVQR